jgi:hypothetical protein
MVYGLRFAEHKTNPKLLKRFCVSGACCSSDSFSVKGAEEEAV